MTERVFIDTNVFVYVDDASAGAKRVRARAVLAEAIQSRRAVISTQVLQEYFVTATRKLGLSAERARGRTQIMALLDVVIIRPETILGAIDLHRLHRISMWDALVIECARTASCATVLTEDLGHGQTIHGVRIVNPFLPATGAGELKARYQTRTPKRKPSRATRR